MAIGQLAEMILLPFLPWFLRHLGMKWVLALGMLAWGIRYGIFALGYPFPLVLVGVALHGICFDFFLAAGFIHVDNESPKEIRASAQALFGFLTYGAGMYIGSELSGYVKERFSSHWLIPGFGETYTYTDWTGFWLGPAIGVLVSLIIFVAFFHSTMKSARTTLPEPAEPETAIQPASQVSGITSGEGA
jgi:hypothetical protein